jgi:hypothetical protein
MEAAMKFKLIEGLFRDMFAHQPGDVRPITVTMNKQVVTSFKPGPYSSRRCLTGTIEGKKITLEQVETVGFSFPAIWARLGFRCAWVKANDKKTAFVIHDPTTDTVIISNGRDGDQKLSQELRDKMRRAWHSRLKDE